MKGTVPVAEATQDEGVLPERVQEALGQLVGAAAREGLLALSVEVGLGVLRELLEQEVEQVVEQVVGPKGKWNPDRSAVRHGNEGGEVTLGGRRVQVKRPRVRTADGESEVPLQTYDHFADRGRLEGWCWSGCSPGCRLAGTAPGARAGRGRARDRRALHVEVGGVADVRAPDPPAAVEPAEPPAGRTAPGGHDARRGRAARPRQHRRARCLQASACRLAPGLSISAWTSAPRGRDSAQPGSRH